MAAKKRPERIASRLHNARRRPPHTPDSTPSASLVIHLRRRNEMASVCLRTARIPSPLSPFPITSDSAAAVAIRLISAIRPGGLADRNEFYTPQGTNDACLR
uniref:Uncharacterized protein n=1 Tax=Plectus sambesii TaxID=2011161 RepID=A0A914VT78_9BILA